MLSDRLKLILVFLFFVCLWNSDFFVRSMVLFLIASPLKCGVGWVIILVFFWSAVDWSPLASVCFFFVWNGKAQFFRGRGTDFVCSMGVAVFDSSPGKVNEIELNRGVIFTDVIMYIVPCSWSFFPEGLLEILFWDVSLPLTGEGVFFGGGSHDEV